ncbi:MAG: hypothetical protein WDW36_001097 [Sanguina aurantia]
MDIPTQLPKTPAGQDAIVVCVDDPGTLYQYVPVCHGGREVGGAMCPLWPQYTEECSMLLFTLDMGNAGALTECMVEFYELLQSPNLAEKPIALVLTKYDLPSLMSRAELDMVMALSDLQAMSPGRVTVFETSAVSGDDLAELLTWVVACKSAATALAPHASQRSSQG